MSEKNPPAPHPIFELAQAYKLSAALFAALDAGVFDALSEAEKSPGGASAGAVAERAGLPPRAAAILLEALVFSNLLGRHEEGGEPRYRLSESARMYLVTSSPDYLGDFSRLTCHPVMWRGFGRLGEALRNDGAVQDIHAETPDNDFWALFSRVTAKTAAKASLEVCEAALPHLPRRGEGFRILDVACGTGYYGGTLALEAEKAGLGPARVTFLDQRNVLPATREWAEKMGVSERASYIEGSLFDVDWKGPYDAVILSHIYHHFDEEACRRITALAAEALAPGGIAAVQEFMADPAPGNLHARFGAVFSLTMLVWTRGGRAYRIADYDSFFAPYGVRRLSARPGVNTPSHILVFRKG
jgi:C-methyltransferase